MEIKEVFDFLGLPADIDSVDKLKTKFESKFITKAVAHEDDEIKSKVSGAIYGGLTTEAKRLFGFKSEEIKDKDFKDILKMGAETMGAKIKSLEDAAGNDERYMNLKKEYDGVLGKFNQTTEDLGKLRKELDDEKATAANQIKSFKVNHAYEAERSKLPFTDGAPEVAKIGFDTVFKSKYKLDLDEQGGPIVMTQDGKRVANPKRTGEYLGLAEVLDLELEAIPGLKKKNNLNGNQQFQFHQNSQQQNQNQNQPGTGVKINNRAAKNAENLSHVKP